MEWSEYVKAAVRTAPDQPPEMQLAQAALGMCDEIRELQQATYSPQRDEEAGDLFWYIALAWDALRHWRPDFKEPNWYTSDHPSAAPANISRAQKAAMEFCGFAEKVAFQAYEPDAEPGDLEPETKIEFALWNLRAVGGVVENFIGDKPFADIWSANIEKLRDRHGSSFSPAGEQSR